MQKLTATQKKRAAQQDKESGLELELTSLASALADAHRKGKADRMLECSREFVQRMRPLIEQAWALKPSCPLTRVCQLDACSCATSGPFCRRGLSPSGS